MVQIASIPHFKGLEMRNLQYEIRICQKGHNKVIKAVLSLLQFFMRQTLVATCRNMNIQAFLDLHC